MRYILNKNGYVCNVSFGADISCDLGDCTEYIGEVPSGYSTIDEWFDEEIDRLNAWKIVNDNLVFDPSKYEELQLILEEEEANNKHVTHKELVEAINNIEPIDEIVVSNTEETEIYIPKKTATGKIISIDDAGAEKIPYVKITSSSDISNEIKLICTNENLLPNEAIDSTIGELEFNINADLSIDVSGILSSEGSISVTGSAVNVEPIFMFKENTSYTLSSLPDGMYWNLYNNDGSEVELIHSSNGGTILLSNDTNVTHVEIAWDNPAEPSEIETIIYPAINLGEVALPYEMHKENIAIINLESNVLNSTGNIVIENDKCVLNDSKNLTIDNFLKTYEGENVIYAFENVDLEVTYIKSDIYESVTASSVLHISDTYVSDEAINKLVIKNVVAGTIKKLISGINTTEITNSYEIDLSDLTGTVDVQIENGNVKIFQDGTKVKTLNDININTYDGNTYIYIQGETGTVFECEYLSSSTFIELHPITIEKTGAVKVFEDKVTLEVTRTSENENISSSIEQTVTDKESSIDLNADTINLNGETYVNGTPIEELGDGRYYTKRDIDRNYYTKTDIDDNHYTKTEIDETHYTKTEIDDSHYTKTEIDENHYTKTEVDENITNLSDLAEGKEDKENKVNTIDENSTDEEYPSAKCVYNLIGNVEALLKTLNSGSGVWE